MNNGLLKPKVSIIIPIYNVEKYLRECLDSVVNQTLKELEIICVNDGSTDGSLVILEEYTQKDSRIKIIDKKNGGYGSACNTGLKNVQGEYVAILEPDDYIDLKMYEDLYKLTTIKDVDVVKSAFFINYDTEYHKKIVNVSWDDYIQGSANVFKLTDYPLFLYFHPSVWSCIYRTEFLTNNNITFIEAKGAGWTDNPFQVQTMCLADKIVYTETPYYYWRVKNVDTSKDLKDFTIPFKRSFEIHKWLDDNKIDNQNLLACLYKRELVYIEIVLRMLKIKDYIKAKKKINKLLSLMDKKIIIENDYINDDERTKYKQYKNNPFLFHAKTRIKGLRKKIISFRWNKNEKCIKLFGVKLLEGKIS